MFQNGVQAEHKSRTVAGQDSGSVNKYFAIIPHIDDDDLTVNEYRLIGHYRKLFGLNLPPETNAQTAAVTGMKVKDVRAARKGLVDKGRITINELTGVVVLVSLVDVMEENVRRYTNNPFQIRQGYLKAIKRDTPSKYGRGGMPNTTGVTPQKPSIPADKQTPKEVEEVNTIQDTSSLRSDVSLSAPLNATPTHAPQADSIGGQTEPNSVPQSKSIEETPPPVAGGSPSSPLPDWYTNVAFREKRFAEGQAEFTSRGISVQDTNRAIERLSNGSLKKWWEKWAWPGGSQDFISDCSKEARKIVAERAFQERMTEEFPPLPVVTYADAQRESADTSQGPAASLRAEMGKLLSERNPVTPEPPAPPRRVIADTPAPDGCEWWYSAEGVHTVAHLLKGGKGRPLCKPERWRVPNKCMQQAAYVLCEECQRVAAEPKAEAKPRPRDAVFDALALGAFGMARVTGNGGRVGRLKNEVLQCIEPEHLPTLAEDLTAAYKWWRETKRKDGKPLGAPASRETVCSMLHEWREVKVPKSNTLPGCEHCEHGYTTRETMVNGMLSYEDVRCPHCNPEVSNGN